MMMMMMMMMMMIVWNSHVVSRRSVGYPLFKKWGTNHGERQERVVVVVVAFINYIYKLYLAYLLTNLYSIRSASLFRPAMSTPANSSVII